MNIKTEGFFESTITMQHSTSSQIIDGTAIAQYQPSFGTDFLLKGGQSINIDTEQHAITFMKENPSRN
jgi:hypothetical protein